MATCELTAKQNLLPGSHTTTLAKFQQTMFTQPATLATNEQYVHEQ